MKRAARVVRDRRRSARDRTRRITAKPATSIEDEAVEPMEEYDTERVIWRSQA